MRAAVLGDPSSGKSTLIHNLKRDHKEVLTPPGTNSVSVGTGTTTLGMNTSSHDAAAKDKSELALSYTYTDVKDDENEGGLWRAVRLGRALTMRMNPAR